MPGGRASNRGLRGSNTEKHCWAVWEGEKGIISVLQVLHLPKCDASWKRPKSSYFVFCMLKRVMKVRFSSFKENGTWRNLNECIWYTLHMWCPLEWPWILSLCGSSSSETLWAAEVVAYTRMALQGRRRNIYDICHICDASWNGHRISEFSVLPAECRYEGQKHMV